MVGTGREQQQRQGQEGQRQDNGTIIPPRKLLPSLNPGPPRHDPLAARRTLTIGNIVQEARWTCTSSNLSRALSPTRPRSWRPLLFPSTHHSIFSSLPNSCSFKFLLAFIIKFLLDIFTPFLLSWYTSGSSLWWISNIPEDQSFGLSVLLALFWTIFLLIRAFVWRWISALWSQSPGVIHLHKLMLLVFHRSLPY